MIYLRLNHKYTLLILLFLVISCNTRPASEQSISLTKTPLLHPTQTLLPTLSPAQVTKIVTDLYMNNGGCQLPCFLGIIPGQTSVQDVYSRFSQIGYFEDQTRVVDSYQHLAFATTMPPEGFISSRNDGRWGFSMRVKNDTVVGFVTGATDIEKFSSPSLSKFLSYFGQPEELRIRVIESQLIDENPDYEIVLYYPSKGIFIRWRGEGKAVLSKTEKGITVTACPQTLPTYSDQVIGLYPPSFYIFSPDETLPFDEIIKTHLSEDPSGSYQSLSIADVQRFYIMYLDTTTQDCFPLAYTW
jgi:hypothetical protein